MTPGGRRSPRLRYSRIASSASPAVSAVSSSTIPAAGMSPTNRPIGGSTANQP